MSNKVSRRSFLKVAGTSGIALSFSGIPLLLSACSTSNEKSSGNSSSIPLSEQSLRTIGLSVTVQDRILEEYKSKINVKGVKGTAATFPDAMNRVLTSGAREYDVAEMIGERVRGLSDADVIHPVSVDKIPNWQFARSIFTEGLPQFGDAQISTQIYTGDKKSLKMVPSVFNYDSIGYNPDEVETVTSWADLFDPKYKGKVALNTDPMMSMPETAMALNTLGELNAKNTGNLSKEEVDVCIDFLIAKKKEGQFRALWGDFGELVNLMASKEVYISDAWQPAVMAVKAQGTPCVYATPQEGYRAWAIGPVIIKGTENLEAAIEYANFWLSGWPAITVSEQGYYSPVTTIKDAMVKEKYEFWYEGKPWIGATEKGIKEGDIRDGGSLEERSKHIGVWHQWPDEYEYYVRRWDEFLSA